MTTIYLIRHGQTAVNIFGGFNGSGTDHDLNEVGQEMARALVGGFADLHLDAIYTSPLKRAVQTAEGVRGSRQMELQVDPDLMEMDFGDWEGLSRKEVTPLYPDAIRLWDHRLSRFVAPNACEGIRTVEVRMLRALLRILRTHRGQTVAIVSHGLALRMMLSRLLRMCSEKCRRIPFLANAAHGVLEVEDDGHFRVRAWNSRDYYRPELLIRQHRGRMRRQVKEMQIRTYFHPALKIKKERKVYED